MFSPISKVSYLSCFHHKTVHNSAYELTVQTEGWIAKEQRLVVQWILLTIDKSCAVVLSSFDDEECLQLKTSPPLNKSHISAIVAGTIVRQESWQVSLGSALSLLHVLLRIHYKCSIRYYY